MAAIVAANAVSESVPWDKIHRLSESQLASLHVVLSATSEFHTDAGGVDEICWGCQVCDRQSKSIILVITIQ